MTNSSRILVVDDTPDLLEFFSTVLEQAGYDVLQATAASDCLRIVREQLPDLVLLDVMLPDLSGIEVCRQIKSDERTAAVLVTHVSGMKTSAENQAEGFEAGADGYLTKPIEPRALLAHVNALLRMRRTEEALYQSEEEFRAVFDNAMDGMLVVDDQSSCIDANPTACSLFDLPRQELLTRRILDLFAHGLYWELESEWQDFLEQGHASGEFRMHRNDGTIRNVEYRAKARFLPGRHLWVLRDITKRKESEEAFQHVQDKLEDRVAQRTAELMAANTFLEEEIDERQRAEEALRQAEEKYRSIFENALDGIFQSTPDGQFISANPAVARMFGYESVDEFITARTNIEHQHYVYPDRRETFKKLMAENGSVQNFELQAYRKDGSIIWTSENGRAVRDATGNVIHYEGIVEDITHRKQVEAERLTLLRRLVTAQEHERRRISRELHDQMGQSLAALMLGLKSLQDSGRFASEHSHLQQLQNLTNQLANEAHILARELRPTALDDLGLHTALSNYVEEWSDRCEIPADFHSNGLLGQRLPGDIETTVYRLVQEALTNIMKHAKAQNVGVIVEHRANRVLVIVEDDGLGFDVEGLLNTPARKRRLGLLGMQERVELVEGNLNIESTPGVGTTVLARIPVSNDHADVENG
jgi:PAS domain S-box-containing protein